MNNSEESYQIVEDASASEHLNVKETVNHGFTLTDQRCRRLQWIFALAIVTQIGLAAFKLFVNRQILSLAVGIGFMVFVIFTSACLLRFVAHKFHPEILHVQNINNGFAVILFKDSTNSWRSIWRCLWSGELQTVELSRIRAIHLSGSEVTSNKRHASSSSSKQVIVTLDDGQLLTVLQSDATTATYAFQLLQPYVVGNAISNGPSSAMV